MKLDKGVGSRIHDGYGSVGLRTKAALGLVILYWLAFEHVLGGNAAKVSPAFASIVLAVKLVVPLTLLLLVPVRRSLLRSRFIAQYFVAFAVFLAWLAIPTVLSGDPFEIVKMLPRYVFALTVVALFADSPNALRLFAKFWVANTVVLLAVFAAMYVTGAYRTATTVADVRFAGPIPFLMNINAVSYVPTVSVPIYRLTGYFKEPSNASAVFFAAYFLARFLAIESDSRWGRAALPCLVAGALCISNAGFLALGLAWATGALQTYRGSRWVKRAATRLSLPVLAGLALVLAVLGRMLAQEYFIDNDWIRLITGLRQVDPTGDVTNGRVAIASNVLAATLSAPFGAGLENFTGATNTYVSATAPLFWLYYGGVPALMILLSREAQLLRAGLRLRHNRAHSAVFQAFVVVLGQGLVYGSWMNPTYFIFGAAVLALGHRR